MRHAAPVILFAFASVLFSCGGAGKEDGGCPGGETPSDMLRVMSFNILYSHRQTEEAYTDGDGRKWAERLPNVVSGLKSRRFDVMASQENTLRQIDDVLDALGDYSAVGKSFGGKAVGAEASDPDAVEVEAVYYRQESVKLLDSGTFWYSETPDAPATARFVDGLELPNNRNCNWAKMEWMGKPFFIFTTHLQVGLDDACVRQRLYQAEILVRKIRRRPGDSCRGLQLHPPSGFRQRCPGRHRLYPRKQLPARCPCPVRGSGGTVWNRLVLQDRHSGDSPHRLCPRERRFPGLFLPG